MLKGSASLLNTPLSSRSSPSWTPWRPCEHSWGSVATTGGLSPTTPNDPTTTLQYTKQDQHEGIPHLHKDTATVKAFRIMKQKLLYAPILAYPQFHGKPFILDTDFNVDSGAIEGVLSQEPDSQERVIAYGARQLQPQERNYASTKGELLAVIFFLQYYKYYLLHRPFHSKAQPVKRYSMLYTYCTPGLVIPCRSTPTMQHTSSPNSCRRLSEELASGWPSCPPTILSPIRWNGFTATSIPCCGSFATNMPPIGKRYYQPPSSPSEVQYMKAPASPRLRASMGRSAQIWPCSSRAWEESTFPPVLEGSRDDVFSTPTPDRHDTSTTTTAMSTTDTVPSDPGHESPPSLPDPGQESPPRSRQEPSPATLPKKSVRPRFLSPPYPRRPVQPRFPSSSEEEDNTTSRPRRCRSSDTDYSREHPADPSDRHRYPKRQLRNLLLAILGRGSILSILTMFAFIMPLVELPFSNCRSLHLPQQLWYTWRTVTTWWPIIARIQLKSRSKAVFWSGLVASGTPLSSGKDQRVSNSCKRNKRGKSPPILVSFLEPT